ncbi:MAG: cation-transporting P-type ATPase [Nitrospiraceae bacterium]|nr:MAG: cation-transporting P-type ATPase [Nitrospiraceae bacterium]
MARDTIRVYAAPGQIVGHEKVCYYFYHDEWSLFAMSPTVEDRTDVTWHALDVSAVFEKTASRAEGLSSEEAARRLAAFGPNRLTAPKKSGPLKRFLMQFHNVLIYVLLIAAFVTALIAHWVDTGVILGVVFLNALIGFIQEGKAERALDAIRSILSLQSLVLRDGKKVLLPAEGLVPGDIVFMQSGDKVPADLRIIRARELRIDEATLTGESVPAEKSTESVSWTAVPGDRKCIAFSATLVTSGQGSGIVVSTGDKTEIGRISMMLAGVKPLSTRLLRQMARFGRILTMAIGAVAAATFVFGILLRSYGISEMFLAAVGLAVAAIPEGLPAIVTITLAIGVQRMARRNAIIRRLPAVETLGSVTVICSDKTGTLTRNEMTVKTVVSARFLFEVTGAGYGPRGGFLLDGRDITPGDYPMLRELCQAGLLCNDAELKEAEGRWEALGDPTEAALLSLGIKYGLDHDTVKEMFPRTDIIPFESEHRFMATLHHDHSGHGFIYVKGAPERIFMMCNRQRMLGEDHPLDVAYWKERIEMIGGKGQRVLAIAFRAADVDQRGLRFADLEGGLSLLGLVGIMDPPREDAIEAVKLCTSAGIRVKMITGDHAATARAIGAQMGIGGGKNVISGLALESMDDDQLRLAVQKTDVFARVSPEHKLRLVEALQENGEVVAMTGDGVNDAPALKRADVGVAMGIKGTDVAKEAAEMVLTDDNFASIARAVEEGRTVYDNIRKSIAFILPTNGGEAGIIIAAILSGKLLPITPVQILWVNMITAVTLALSLAFEPSETRVMLRPPRRPDEPVLSYFLVWRILFVSAIMITGTFGLFLWDEMHQTSIEHSRTVAVNTIVMFEVFYLLNTRFLKTPILVKDGFTGNRYIYIAIISVTAAQLLFTYSQLMNSLFTTTGIGMMDWARIMMVACSVFFLVEIEKYIIHRYERRREIPRNMPGHVQQ